jgi:hypothetical protein
MKGNGPDSTTDPGHALFGLRFSFHPASFLEGLPLHSTFGRIKF